MQMDSDVNGEYLPERKHHRIPYFLQSKQIPNTQNPQKKIKKIINVTKQFQQFTYVGQKKKSSFHKRTNLFLKNTPKVIIVGEENQKLTALIECPKKLFIQNLKTCRKSVQIQKIIEIVQTLFQLVRFYGYFYCDKFLIRVSQNGTPVAWINQRFQQCERQFPIKRTPISQLIFVKNLVQIFRMFISFPSQIETKQQINAFLEQQKAKFKTIHVNFLGFISRKTSDLTQSLQLFEKQQLKSSIKSEMPKAFSTINKNGRQCKPFLSIHKEQHKNLDVKSQSLSKKSKSKNKYEQYTKNHQNNKHNKFLSNHNHMDVNIYNSNKQLRLMRQKSQKGYETFNQNSPKNKVIDEQRFQPLQKLKLSYKTSKNLQQQQDIVYDQHNFETFSPLSAKSSLKRQNSVNLNLVNSWHTKSQKFQKKKLPDLTFSTGMTIRIYQQNKNNQQPKQKKNQQKKKNLAIPHLYSLQRQKQIKLRLSGQLNKIMKESSFLIQQQNSFENQIQNLFQSNIQQQNSNKMTLKKSILLKQIEQLFNTSNNQQII